MLVEESSEPSWRFPRPGDSTQANNWRTIAVRKITYKGFAKLLGARNSDGLESAQCADQVGFRSKLENSFRRTVLQTPERGPSAANYWARPGLEPHPPHLTLPKLTTGRRRVAAPQTSQRERHSGEAARRQGWQCWTWEMTASWLRRNAQLRQEKPRITQTTVPCACCLGDKIGTCLCGSLAQIHVVEFNQRVQLAWNTFHRHRRVLVNKHVAIKLRMKFYAAVVTPTMLSGLHTLALTAVQLSKLESIQRRMLRSMVGWIRIQDETWHDAKSRMNTRVATALRQHPIETWTTRIAKCQHSVACRVA